VKKCEKVWIHVKKCEFGSTVPRLDFSYALKPQNSVSNAMRLFTRFYGISRQNLNVAQNEIFLLLKFLK
jgi:hypothetical protein